jgi:hypothetical protein
MFLINPETKFMHISEVKKKPNLLDTRMRIDLQKKKYLKK